MLVTVSALWLFLTVPWIGQQCVIVELPDHTSTHTYFFGQMQVKIYVLISREAYMTWNPTETTFFIKARCIFSKIF